MISYVLLSATPFVAKDAGLSWSFDGTSKAASGRYYLVGKELRGEVLWFIAPTGRFDAVSLYKSDTQHTKEADETKGFIHVQTKTTFAGVPAIRSDQWYKWKDVPVASRCVYAAKGNRAWVVRLWWSPLSKGDQAADALLKSFTALATASSR